MSKAFFISDVHLGAEDEAKENRKRKLLAKFFDMVSVDGDKLFILGDFFNFWFDYKGVVFSAYFDVLCKLRELSLSGVEIHFFGGNHDWWASKTGFLSDYLGMIIHSRAEEVIIDGRRFFVGHGDGMVNCDWAYKFLLKPVIRNAVSIALFKIFPAQWAMSLARLVSPAEKLYKRSPKEAVFVREYEEFAGKKIKEGFDFVILGHLHIPIEKNLFSGKYINTGDFYRNFTYAVFDGRDAKLMRFEEVGDDEK